MARIIVAISKVENGNMYIPDDTTNQTVINNRQVWLQSQGIELDHTTRMTVTYERPDFCRYYTVAEEHKGVSLPTADSVPADGLIVTKLGHALFLLVADCVATVFFDEVHSVFMLSHLGRHSLEQQGGVKSVEYLVEHFGVNPATLKVWLAPSPSKEAYPIFALGNKGMKEVVYQQLAEAGVIVEHITDNSADTVTNQEYYSHTAFLKGDKPEDGRFAMVAMMVEDESIE
jgi:copper oxidase (laccase) domain-containing protein